MQDVRVQCYTAEHTRAMRTAAVGIVVFPVGVPLLFACLILYYRVPSLTRELLRRNALRHAVRFFQRVRPYSCPLEGLASPSADECAHGASMPLRASA